jgi:hypothetical protein
LWLGSTAGGNSGVIVGTPTNPSVAIFTGALAGDPNLTINVTTGIGQALSGGQGSLDLNSINVSVGAHAATDVLSLLLTETGFGPIQAGTLVLAIGGTLDSAGTTSLTAWGKKDPTNTAWGGLGTPPTPPTAPDGFPGNLSGNFTGVLGPFTGAGGFSGNTNVAHPALGTYSLTEEVKITFAPSTANQTVSFNFSLTNFAVPEPSTLAIGGLAGLGFLVYGLRRRKVSGA